MWFLKTKVNTIKTTTDRLFSSKIWKIHDLNHFKHVRVHVHIHVHIGKVANSRAVDMGYLGPQKQGPRNDCNVIGQACFLQRFPSIPTHVHFVYAYLMSCRH